MLSRMAAGVAVALAFLAVTPIHAITVPRGRQYDNAHNYINGYGNNGVSNQIRHQNAGDSSDTEFQDNNPYSGGDYSALLRNYGKNGYYDAYNNVDYHDSAAAAAAYASAASSYASAAENPDSSPALSALALLGFLYFLNLIQDTLQNNNGRRKRSVAAEDEVQNLEEELPRIPRSLSFLEDFFVDLPKALGFSDRSGFEHDGRTEVTRRSGLNAIAGFLTSRLSLISSIMSFLKDPRPSRVRRSTQLNQVDADGSFDILGSFDFLSQQISHYFRKFSQDSSEALRNMLKPDSVLKDYEEGEPKDALPGTTEAREEDPVPPPPSLTLRDGDDGNWENAKARVKRFTYGMNSWYEESEGRIYDPKEPKPVGGLMGQLLKLLGADKDLRRDVAVEALPLFEDMSQGLDGDHPQCLQRALCHINHLASSMSAIPRISLRLLSNNLADLAPSEALLNKNMEAIASGLRGEDCNTVFVGCDRNGGDDSSASP